MLIAILLVVAVAVGVASEYGATRWPSRFSRTPRAIRPASIRGRMLRAFGGRARRR